MSAASFGRVQVHNTPDIKGMVRLVARQVDASVRDPWTRAYATEIVRAGQPMAVAGGPKEEDQIGRIFWHVKTNIAYLQDPRGYEFIATAKRTVQIGSGDCDDHVVLVASLLSSIGFSAGARIISPNNQDFHIYTLCMYDPIYKPTRYITLDTTQKESTPGWEAPPAMRRTQFDVIFADGKAHLADSGKVL